MAEYPLKKRWDLVRGNNLPPKLRHALTVLMLFQGKNESAWFKRKTMADELGIDVDVLSRKLKQLEAIGAVDRMWRANNGKPSRHYKINFEMLSKNQRTLTVGSECTLTRESECEGATLTVESESPRPSGQGHLDPAVRHEHPIEHPIEHSLSCSKQVSNDRFEEFWNSYSRKIGLKKARASFDRAVKAGTDPQKIIAAATKYAAHFKSDRKFQKHPTTWLNGEHWNDDPETWASTAPAQDSADDCDEVFATIRQTYSPDLNNAADVEAALTPEQYKAAKAVGLKRIANSDSFDKSTPEAYREARKAVA